MGSILSTFGSLIVGGVVRRGTAVVERGLVRRERIGIGGGDAEARGHVGGDALGLELRAARRACGRTSDRENLDLQTRAEANLNALLEYRHAAECREAVPADGRARLRLGARR